jgi:hypothetical protein
MLLTEQLIVEKVGMVEVLVLGRIKKKHQFQ